MFAKPSIGRPLASQLRSAQSRGITTTRCCRKATENPVDGSWSSILPEPNTPPNMLLPRYAGIPTFMRANHFQAPLTQPLDIAMLGVPFDGGVTNRPGARHGPRDVRNASTLMRAIHHYWRFAPFSLCSIADVGDVPIYHVFDCGKAHKEIEAFVKDVIHSGSHKTGPIGARNVLPLSVGGDHSVTLPLLRAVAASYPKPLSLIHIDAHLDTWDEVWGEKDHHGAPIRRAIEAGAIDPKRTVQIGIRGPQNFSQGWDYAKQVGTHVMFMHDVEEAGIQAVINRARDIVGHDTPTYITFDIDSLDPVFAPGTGTPEAGGFTMREAQQLIRGLRGLNIVGADVVEVSPPFDVGASGGGFGITSLNGATVMFELMCIMADTRNARLKLA
eukprot:c8361_g1_i1.p1 GENE.c8361_g1_i1~~c8361_g1_i1.p1  ORF type:complete len:399 (+),score=111.20 c8361_g1_i1:42-1199(+)